MSFIDAPIGTRMDCFALVKKSEVRTSAKGSQYLDMDLADKDGEINAKFWAYENSATPNFQPNDIVKIRGTINEYRGTRQFRIERIRPALKTDNVDPADYVAAAEYSGEAMYNAICDLARSFQDDDLRELVLAVYQKYRESLLTHPAAIRLHHAMRGGLLYHTLSIIRMAQAAAKVYPSIDEDLLLTGAALHDIGKLVEIQATPLGVPTQYSVDGTPEDKLVLVEHMIISHHGKPEFGAAEPPKFLEAIVLAKLDELDATVFEVESTVKAVGAGEFSNRVWALDDRRLYNPGRKDMSTEADLLKE